MDLEKDFEGWGLSTRLTGSATIGAVALSSDFGATLGAKEALTYIAGAFTSYDSTRLAGSGSIGPR